MWNITPLKIRRLVPSTVLCYQVTIDNYQELAVKCAGIAILDPIGIPHIQIKRPNMVITVEEGEYLVISENGLIFGCSRSELDAYTI